MNKSKMGIAWLLLALVMVFVTACGNTTAKTPATDATPSGTTVDAGEPAEEGGAEEGGVTEGEAKYGGVLVAYTSGDPQTFDPAALSLWDQTIVAANILEGLVRLNPEGTDIEPGIASDWSVSKDGLTWTFNLREGAMFHNGREIVAGDFKYSFERVADPETASPSAWMLNKLVGFDEFNAGNADEITGIKVIDDYTLELTLTEAYAPLVTMLSAAALAVVPQEAVEEFGADFGQNVVAAGPFTIGQWNFNQDLTINAFEDYWDGRPYLDGVKFKVIGDENTRIVEFDAQTLDVAWIPPAHYERFTTDPTFKDSIGVANTLHTSYLAFNMESDVFGANKALREAVFYAIDNEAVIAFLQGRAAICNTLLPTGMLGSFETAEADMYDVELAKTKMEEAGYADGLDVTFDIITPSWNNNIKILEIIQQNLKEVGINFNIVSLEFQAYLEALNSGSFDVAWGYTVASYPDSDAMIFPMLHSNNIGNGNAARYNNAEVDTLIDQARTSTNSDERASLYQEIDGLVFEDLPYAYLNHNVYVDICQPYVKNYTPSAVDVSTYHRVWLDK